MRVWACSVVRDEEDILEYTLRHLVEQGVDGFALLDHNSSDGTRAVIERVLHQHMCVLFSHLERPFTQGPLMTSLAQTAYDKGADWILPFDADELWYSCGRHNVSDTLRHYQGGAVIRVPLWDHLPTTRDYDGEANPFVKMPYRRKEMFSASKIAYRAGPEHICSDGSHLMMDRRTTLFPRAEAGDIGIRHFPFRGFDHFLRKVRKMAEGLEATAQPAAVGIQWRAFGRLDDAALKAVYYSRFYQLDPEDNGLVYDPAPYRGNP